MIFSFFICKMQSLGLDLFNHLYIMEHNWPSPLGRQHTETQLWLFSLSLPRHKLMEWRKKAGRMGHKKSWGDRPPAVVAKPWNSLIAPTILCLSPVQGGRTYVGRYSRDTRGSPHPCRSRVEYRGRPWKRLEVIYLGRMGKWGPGMEFGTWRQAEEVQLSRVPIIPWLPPTLP